MLQMLGLLRFLSARSPLECTLYTFVKSKVPCGTKFLRVLIFAILAVFSAIRCRNYIQKYWFEGEDAIDNSLDNTSSGTLGIVDPL